MSGGDGAASRNKARRAKAKQQAKKAAEKLHKLITRLPQVTEDDLLAFQFQHFGDDTRPENWFVNPEQATNYEPEGEDKDDELGYYADGTKRTLTDDQIEIFRRKELYDLEREKQRQAADPPVSPTTPNTEVDEHPHSKTALPSKPDRRSATPNSTTPWKRKRSQPDVPYDQRHKRRWEEYIVGDDPVEGAMTHRRIARELDEQQAETLELEY